MAEGWNDPEPPPERMPVDDPCVWMITYSESGIPPEVFSGRGATEAAHRRFDQVRNGYSCSLFVRVAKG